MALGLLALLAVAIGPALFRVQAKGWLLTDRVIVLPDRVV